jgi:hypothetical protein
VQAQQVGAEHELERVLGGEVVAGLRGLVARGRGAEVELAVDHRDLVADLGGQPAQELPVGHVALGDVLVDGAGRVDPAGRDPGPLGDLLGDVGVGDAGVGLGDAAPEQPVRLVEAAQDRARAERVEVGLDRGDLALDELLAARGGLRDQRHRDLRPDLRPRAFDERALGIAEGEHEHVGQGHAVLDDPGGQLALQLGGQRLAADLDASLVAGLLLLLSHAGHPRR